MPITANKTNKGIVNIKLQLSELFSKAKNKIIIDSPKTKNQNNLAKPKKANKNTPTPINNEVKIGLGLQGKFASSSSPIYFPIKKTKTVTNIPATIHPILLK